MPAYCIPINAGAASNPRSVCRRLAKLLDALSSTVNSAIVSGEILEDTRKARLALIYRLELGGWDVRVTASDVYAVRPPTDARRSILRRLRAAETYGGPDALHVFQHIDPEFPTKPRAVLRGAALAMADHGVLEIEEGVRVRLSAPLRALAVTLDPTDDA